MSHNFRVAKHSRDEMKEQMDTLNADMLKVLEQDGGVSALDADGQFKVRSGQLIRQVVTDTFSLTDPTPIFTERRDARLGDKVEFEQLVNTFRVVKYAPQSHPLTFTPRKSKYTVSTSSYELAFGIELMKVMTRQHTIGEMAQMAAQALTRHYVNLTLTAIDAACAAGNNDMRGRALRSNIVGGGDVTKTALDTQLRRMATYNSGLTIFASKYALQPIFDFGATTEISKEEFRTRGQIGVYRGAKLVAIEDDFNEYYGEWTSINGEPLEDLTFIAGSVPGATLLERDLSPLNWEKVDVEKAIFRTGIRFDHGIYVHKPWRYGVIETNA